MSVKELEKGWKKDKAYADKILQMMETDGLMEYDVTLVLEILEGKISRIQKQHQNERKFKIPKNIGCGE